MIYHITTSAEWENAKKIGGYTPQAFERDGFIHCSDLYQVEDVANHFYRDLSGLILLCIEPALTGIPLVYENTWKEKRCNFRIYTAAHCL